jgi:hypothetical protein
MSLFSFIMAAASKSAITGPPVWTTASLPAAQGLVAYSTTLVATGTPTFSIVSGALPSGLTLSGGVISGMPANMRGTAQYNVTIAATNILGTANQTFTIVVTQNKINYDPYSEGVVLLMPLTGVNGATSGAAFADSIGHSVTVTGSPVVATQSTYNGLNQVPAVYFPGSAYFTLPLGNEFVFATNDYTIEWSILGNQSENILNLYFGATTSSNSPFNLYGGAVYMSPFGSAATGTSVLTYTAPTVTNAWVTYAFVKHGSTLTLYLNGQVVATTTSSSVASMATPLYAVVGAVQAITFSLRNVRITNGAARYNGAYSVPATFPTPPTFTAAENTVLGILTSGVTPASNITLAANDPWGLGLTFSADGLPTGLSINATTGVISGTPTGYTTDTGEMTVTATVTDAYFNSQTRTFLISVLASPQVDSAAGNTVLLMHFDGANAATTFTDVLGHTVSTYTGSPVLSTAQVGVNAPPFGGSCLYLNGSSAIQIAPLNNDWNLGANDFTLECSMCPTVVSGNMCLMGNLTTTAAQGWLVFFSASAVVVNCYSSATETVLTFSGATFVANTWYRIAIVRKSGSVSVYVNGALYAAAQSMSTILPAATNLAIGVYTPSNNSYFTGYLDELRVTNGYARYSAAYTVATTSFANPITWPISAAIPQVSGAAASFSLIPTEPYGASLTTMTVSGLPSGLTATNGLVSGTMPTVSVDTSYQVTASAASAYSSAQKTYVITNYATPSAADPYAADVTCFMNFNGIASSTPTSILYNPAFTDQTGLTAVVPVGNPTISTSVVKNSGGSLSLNGSSALNLYATSAATLGLGANDFTIEFSVYMTTISTNNTFIASAPTSATISWGLNYSTSPSQVYLFYTTNGSSTSYVDFAWSPVVNTWYTIACVRKGGSLYCFVNGSQISTTQSFAGVTLYPTTTLQIGYYEGASGQYVTGYMDGIRITNGFGRYTANYTPAEFPVPVVWTTPSGVTETIIGGNAV